MSEILKYLHKVVANSGYFCS